MFTRQAAMVMVLLLGLVCPGCGVLGPPTSADDVRTDWSGFGSFTFHKAGDDATAWNLVRNHGWQTFGGHVGGPGGTLQVVDPTGGVVLIWAHNLFNGFILTEGWTGETPNGAHIGTTLGEFRELHPEFAEVGTGSMQLQRGTTLVTATFEEDMLGEVDVRDY